MDNIRDILKKSKNAVMLAVVLLVLKMVEALVKGLNVHLVEMMPHVMSVMDAETAGYIEQEMLSYGVNIHTGKEV